MQKNREAGEPQVTFSEKLKGIPGLFGIRLFEQPHYEVLVSDGHREIRRYNPVTMATVSATGSYEQATESAFTRLADYTFTQTGSLPGPAAGSPEMREPIAMTAPVLHQKSRGGWTLSFVLPDPLSLESAPRPSDSGITLQTVPARLLACLRYSGTNDEKKIEEYSKQLLAWIEKNGTFRATGEVLCAQYDGPHTIPFLRRNEIQIPVLVKH